MKKMLLGLLLALACLTANADVIARAGKDTLILSESVSCPKEIAAVAVTRGVPAQLADQLKLATATIGGVKHRACWMFSQGMVGLIYEDGDTGVVPAEMFEKLKEV